MTQYEYEPADDESPSEAVVRAVANATNQSPLELDPLFQTIDTTGLNSLVSHDDASEASVTISFDYAGFTVTVSPDEVRVDPVQ